MGYEVAINKAWEGLAGLTPQPPKVITVKFFADEYTVDLAQKKVLFFSCNAPAKDFTAILILHYLIKKVQGLPGLSGEWLPFRELSGIEGYYPAFRKRSIEPIIRKYGSNPQGILSVLERLPGEPGGHGDVSIVLEAFAGVPVLISLWRPDEEFAPQANIFFDKSVTSIFCTEDIVVLAGIVAGFV